MAEAKTITPNELASEIFGVEQSVRQGKRIRAYLRSNGHRNMAEQKGQAWSLAPNVANEVRAKFTPQVTK